jgi:hypothetical protein
MPDLRSLLAAVSPWAWAGLCLAVAAVWVFVVPRPQLAGATGWRRFLLRWGHALVWLLLALSFGLRAAGQSGLADPVAAAGGLTYVAFLGALVISRAASRR